MSASDQFDPYRKWLGIPEADQPPHHYRLLGVGLFEDDADTIATAADRQMAHIRTFQIGAHSALSQKLLNELSAARLTLLDEKKKAAYDQHLRAKLAPPATADRGSGQASQPPSMPMPIAVAIPAAAPAGQSGAGRLVDAPALTISAAASSPSLRSRGKRSRPDKMLWVGVAAATAVLAVVVYVASAPSPEPTVATKVVARNDASPASIEPRPAPDIATTSPGDKRPGETRVDDPPAQPEAKKSSNEMPSPRPAVSAPPVSPPAESMPADSLPSQLKPAEEPSPPAQRPSLAELLSRVDRPRIDIRRRDAAPEGRALTAANARFAEVYGKAVANAKTAEAVQKLSLRFLNLAREGADSSDVRFVLLGQCGLVAAGQGNVGMAYRAAAEATRQFEVDPFSLRLKALETASKIAATPVANAVGALQTMALAESAAAEGKSDLASKAAGLAVVFARKTKDKELKAQVDQVKAALREQSTRNAAYQRAVADLKKQPDSPEANLAAAKYELLVLGDWPAGLAKLAASGDAPWWAIAEGEALARDDLSRWAPLAGLWWDRAAGEEDEFFQHQCRLQAKYCYLRAKRFGGTREASGEMVGQLQTLDGYPLSRLRPGIAARYYEGERFERQRLERIDPQIDFFFGPGSPDPTVRNDHFSARWTGFFKPPIGGRYLIVTATDDAIRLWVDGKLVLDRWVIAPNWQQVELELTPEPHTIQMEYNEWFGPAFALLGWTLAAFPDPDHVQWSPIGALYYDPASPFELPERP